MPGIPWALVGQVVLGLINFFIRRNDHKQKLAKDMMEFIAKHDKSALENVKLRKEYETLRKKILKERE